MGMHATMSKTNPGAKTIDIFVDSKVVNEKLLQLSMKTGYSCIQRNGQRYFGPPPNWTGPPPAKGSEVFIGRIPRDCFEDELVPFLTRVAPLYEMRMMMNFTGFNRGFAFATFCSPEAAWRAVLALHDAELRPGHPVGVFKSIDNCRLYVGGIPTDKTRDEAWDELVKVCPTVKEIILYPHPKDRRRNRGFLFVEFESHRAAAMGKRNLAPGARLWGRDVVVDWALPEPDIDPSIMAQVTKLFIRSAGSALSKELVARLVRDAVPAAAVARVYVAGHYGFLHFHSREHAQLAKDKLQLARLDGEPLEVLWARPKCFRAAPPAKHCRSVPPRFRRELEGRASPEPEAAPPALPPPPLALPPECCCLDPPLYPFPPAPQPFLVYTHNRLSFFAH